ncbi:hypothetical protein [Tsukamurella spumae]|uniref:Uncharacterized protein n=1 Tax=Tsukamurella spumae TaxID=44753 RepID=A0A846WYS1_9ACTN|nr:hypothetical protein [Tsukamurella spumae]NKY18031.1 hypothetical protein [Tsukamurella spumae]
MLGRKTHREPGVHRAGPVVVRVARGGAVPTGEAVLARAVGAGAVVARVGGGATPVGVDGAGTDRGAGARGGVLGLVEAGADRAADDGASAVPDCASSDRGGVGGPLIMLT